MAESVMSGGPTTNISGSDTRPGQPSQGTSDQSSRSRSTIEFPYLALDEGISMARAVYEVGGGQCEWAQVAATVGQAAKGGAFRQKMIAARTFGLLEYKGQEVSLTDLGRKALNPDTEKAAKVDSFLSVELFSKAFEMWRDNPMPPPAAVQRRMVDMGVAPKQADKARQVFMRSARSAGFFELKSDTLVKPNTNQPVSSSEAPPVDPVEKNNGDGGGAEPPDLHPFVAGLLQELPRAHEKWEFQKRAKWLQTAASIFDMIYEDDGVGEIKIKFERSAEQVSPAQEWP